MLSPAMRRLRALLATAAMAASTLIISAAPASAAIGVLRYAGTAIVGVDYYDLCGTGATRRYIGTRRYQQAVAMIVTDRGVGDPNPYRFSLATTLQGTGEGQFGLNSALTTAQYRLVYWSLSQAANGQLAGTLVNSHRQEAAAANLLFSNTPLIPCRDLGGLVNALAISENARLAGNLTTAAATLVITGATVDTLRVFRADVSVRRA
jgi:hypothetical protein